MRTNFKGFFFFLASRCKKMYEECRGKEESRSKFVVSFNRNVVSFNYRKGSYRISLSDISGRFLCQEVAEKDKEDNLRSFYRQYRFI